jgi:hypothetical protein
VAERLRQYESLRRQVLEPEPRETSNPSGLERAFLERRGLVAWMEYTADYPPAGVVPIDEQTPKRRESEAPHSDLVLVLAGLVVGDRQEVHHG